MANYNLTDQTISSSFEQLLQKDTDTGYLVDGTGSVVDGLSITGSLSATSLSGDGNGITNLNSKYATTGSNTFTGNQTINGTTALNGYVGLNGELETYTSNISNYGGRIQGIAHGFLNGSSLFTGSFSGNGSGITNLNAKYATTGSNNFNGTQSINGELQVISANITNIAGRYQGTDFGNSVGNSTFTGSFQGDGSGVNGVVSSSHSEVADEVPFSGVTDKPTLVSGSSQIILQSTTGQLSGSRIDGVVANSTNSVYSQNTITTGKNLHTTTILKGTPLFFTGSGTSGNLVGILPADAGNPARMPAGGVAGESIVVGAEGVVLLDGFIGGVNTTGFTSGQKIYVGVGGGYTNVEPTGSAFIQFLGNIEKGNSTNGSGVIQMMGESRKLPNLPQGTAWVGDSNGVPQTVATSSFGGGVSSVNTLLGDLTIAGGTGISVSDNGTDTITITNTGGGGTIDTGSFATTGSNTFVGTQTISSNNVLVTDGSVRITTDNDANSFKIQNNNGASWNQTISTNPGTGTANAFTDYLGVETVFFQTDGNFSINSKQGGASGSIGFNGYDVNISSDNPVDINNRVKIQGSLYQDLGNEVAVQVRQNENIYSQYYGNVLQWAPNTNNGQSTLNLLEKKQTVIEMNAWSGAYDESLTIKVQEGGASFSDWVLPSYTATPWLTIPQQGIPTFQRGLEITGSAYVSQSLFFKSDETSNATSNKIDFQNGQTIMVQPKNDPFSFLCNNGAFFTAAGASGAKNMVFENSTGGPIQFLGKNNGSLLFSSSFSEFQGNTVYNGFMVANQGITSNGFLELSGSVEISGSTNQLGDVRLNGALYQELGNGLAAQVRQNEQFYSEYYGNVLSWEPNTLNGQANLFMGEKKRTWVALNAFSGAYDEVLNIKVEETGVTFADWQLPSYTDTIWLTVPQGQKPTFDRGVSVNTAMNLVPQDPLPSGNLGDLAVSGSTLYFNDGTWRQVSLV